MPPTPPPPRRRTSPCSETDAIPCGFSVVVDSREQRPFAFAGFKSDEGEGGRPLLIPTVRAALPVGDYSIFGLETQVVIERKSGPDLVASVVRRDNFVARLERMAAFAYAAVVVEADWSMLADPSFTHSAYPIKSLVRTLIAWDQRYPVRWWFLPSRAMAEAVTFRMLQRFWREQTR